MFSSTKGLVPSAAVTPQTILYRFARYYPAASVVEAAVSQSRLDVGCNPSGTATRQRR